MVKIHLFINVIFASLDNAWHCLIKDQNRNFFEKNTTFHIFTTHITTDYRQQIEQYRLYNDYLQNQLLFSLD
jgi:hypothetical protein